MGFWRDAFCWNEPARTTLSDKFQSRFNANMPDSPRPESFVRDAPVQISGTVTLAVGGVIPFDSVQLVTVDAAGVLKLEWWRESVWYWRPAPVFLTGFNEAVIPGRWRELSDRVGYGSEAFAPGYWVSYETKTQTPSGGSGGVEIGERVAAVGGEASDRDTR